MALQGWRLFGIAGTIFAYIAGILFLSIINMQSPHPKQPRLGRFGEINGIRSRDPNSLNRKQPIQWCIELKFLDGRTAFQTITKRHLHFTNKHKHSLKLKSNKFETKLSEGDRFRNNSTSIRTKEIAMKKNDETLQNGLIALASFPGSGNTWLRYLLQQSTGILTGSIYKDYGLLKSGFPAENISNKSVLLVKTHEWGPNAWAPFEKAILLIRDPDKAILAEFNRQSGGHVGFASPDRYKRTKGRYWQQFVSNKLNGWESMNLGWARNFTGSLKIVYYDDLVLDVEGSLREILSFLNFPINEELLTCALLRKEGIYRRKKRILNFDPYSVAMHKFIDNKKYKVYSALGRHT